MVPSRSSALGLRVTRSAALIGCSLLWLNTGGSFAAPLRPADPAAWETAVRQRGVDPAAAPFPFRATEEMRDVAREWAGHGDAATRLERLRRSLLNQREFPFKYDSRRTLLPPDAFRLREGNCLSFTAMFIALARSVGIRVDAARPQAIRPGERSGDLIIVNSHVVALFRAGAARRTFDFDLTGAGPIVTAEPMDDVEVGAMFLSNLAVEDLRSGLHEQAATRLTAAVQLDPEFTAAWANLGVARRRLGDVQGSLRAYDEALRLAPRDAVVLTNLAGLYRALSRPDEAGHALDAAAASGPVDLLVVRGEIAVSLGRVAEAEVLFRRAHRAERRRLEPLLGLARAQIARNRMAAARRTLRRVFLLDPTNIQARELERRLGQPTS